MVQMYALATENVNGAKKIKIIVKMLATPHESMNLKCQVLLTIQTFEFCF